MPKPSSTCRSTPQTEAPADVSRVYRYAGIDASQASDETALASEIALAISYNGLAHAVMMVSPDALEDFVVGFTRSSGTVQRIDEIYDIRLEGQGEAWHADLLIGSRAFWQLKRQRRQLAGSSGCGLCGVDSLEQALPSLPSLPRSPLPDAVHLHGLRERIGDAQTLARHSGALHAALFVDAQGEIRLCREDIGRHNALDKLIGALARQRIDATQGFAVVTSRCGLELLHKAVRAGIGSLVSLAAPTALTVDWARQHNLNLIHLPQRSLARVYSPTPDS
jgi:FdhD protein